MRRIATWLLVGAVAALGVAACGGCPARRRRGGSRSLRPQASADPGLTGRPARQTVSQLREAGVSGVLTYSDDDCRLHAVSLPALEPARAPSFEMCRPRRRPGGLGAVDGDVVWAGLGYGAVQVVLTSRRRSRARSATARHPRADAEARFRAVQAVGLGERARRRSRRLDYEPRERVARGLRRRAAAVRPAALVGRGRAGYSAESERARTTRCSAATLPASGLALHAERT